MVAVSVTALKQFFVSASYAIDGGVEVNEVFFDDVKVPVENLVGEENDGFAQIAIGFVGERIALAAQGSSA